jgi:hypothetical protein
LSMILDLDCTATLARNRGFVCAAGLVWRASRLSGCP